MPLPKMNCYYDDDVVSSATREWGGGAIYGSPPDPGVYFRVMHWLRPGIYLRSDVDVKLSRRKEEEDVKRSRELRAVPLMKLACRKKNESFCESPLYWTAPSVAHQDPILAWGKRAKKREDIDISRLTKVRLTVTAYYNERARISDHGSRWGDDGGGRSADTGRATELEQKRSRVRVDSAHRERQRVRGWEGKRRQAFTCGRHPMMHSCCWHAGTSGSHDLSSAAIIRKATGPLFLPNRRLFSLVLLPVSLLPVRRIGTITASQSRVIIIGRFSWVHPLPSVLVMARFTPR